MHPDEQYQYQDHDQLTITDKLIHLYDEVFGSYDDESETVDHHENMVRMKAKPGVDILQSLTPEKCHLWHMATGLSTESGELLDAVKKHVIYNKPLDIENVVEELGDVLFYLQGVIQHLQDTIEEPCLIDIFTILMYNIQKLENRYKEQYSDQEAQERRDKQTLEYTDPTTEND